MRELRSSLVDCSPGMLRAIAEARGVELSSGRQIEMVRELSGALLQPASLQDALKQPPIVLPAWDPMGSLAE